MRLMRTSRILICYSAFLLICYVVYPLVDLHYAFQTAEQGPALHTSQNLNIIKKKIKQLEDDIRLNEQTVQEIREKIHQSLFNQKKVSPVRSLQELSNRSSQGDVNPSFIVGKDSCQFSSLLKSRQAVDVQMLDLYETLKFENLNGGVWKQGWNVTYRKREERTLSQLKVFVVPHSHCDPGWIKTYMQYYQDQVRDILSNALSFLREHADMTFIYAEMSFFQPWFTSLSEADRQKVKSLPTCGIGTDIQLLLHFNDDLLPSSGWVMVDEAAAHYFAVIDQLIEGHQFLENYLEYKPKNHWSIDPFGISASLAFLLRLAGFETMSIHRVHYSVKKHLARNKQLEFYWRPLWQMDDGKDIFCHMLPFYSYDVPHTCGPDPSVCCQFDFPRMNGMYYQCPWGTNPTEIDADNVAEKARLLLDQFRKQAQLYQTRSLLVPLGDDFRYSQNKEWNVQYENYKALFSYMNSNKELNVHAQFGTLADYYASLVEEQKRKRDLKFPVLSGDFFTYADRDQDYWSGYFTSRPFHKALDRVLEKYLRGADILFSAVIGRSSSEVDNLRPENPVSDYFQKMKAALYRRLVSARRSLGLFQHHDGISGTAKTYVMADYAAKLAAAVADCQAVIAASIVQLFASNRLSESLDYDSPDLEFLQEVKPDRTAQELVLDVTGKPRMVVAYNSLPYRRVEMICVKVKTGGGVTVTDVAGQKLSVQISPLVKKENANFVIGSAGIYEVCWKAVLQSLGVSQYSVSEGPKSQSSFARILSSVIDLNAPEAFSVMPLESQSSIKVSSKTYSLRFDPKTGFLKDVTNIATGQRRMFELEFVEYASDTGGSGAYLFLAGKKARVIRERKKVLLVDGPLFATIYSCFAQTMHAFRVVKNDDFFANAFHISNVVDITGIKSNYELAMRLKTNVKDTAGEHSFYTDMNGLMMIRRKYFEKLPIQGNVYPLVSATFLQSDDLRLTVLSAQSSAVSSPASGMLDVFLDRRSKNDDNRGLTEPLRDNMVFTNVFRLVLEDMRPSNVPSSRQRSAALTLLSHHHSLTLINSPFILTVRESRRLAIDDSQSSLLSQSFPCDHHLVNMRPLEDAQTELPSKRTALIVHRLPVDCDAVTHLPVECRAISQLNLKTDFKFGKIVQMEETTLTLMYSKSNLSAAQLRLEPMDLRTFRLTWK